MIDKVKKSIRLLILAYKDGRTPWYARAVMGLAIGYALSPIDLIPDFIPLLGQLDDLIILPVLAWLSFKLIPEEVLADCRARIEKN